MIRFYACLVAEVTRYLLDLARPPAVVYGYTSMQFYSDN